MNDGINWRAVALALARKYVGERGVFLVGAASQAYVAERMQVAVRQDGDAIRVEWTSPSLAPDASDRT